MSLLCGLEDAPPDADRPAKVNTRLHEQRNVDHPANSATKMPSRWVLRFGLRTLFAFTTVAAWCSWQWGVAQKRARIASELRDNYCAVYRDSTVAHAGVEKIWWGQVLNGKRGERIDSPLLLAVTGISNIHGLTAVVFPPQLGGEWEDARIRELSLLPGLTTVLILSANSEMLNGSAVESFERKLQARLPRLKIKRVICPPVPVG